MAQPSELMQKTVSFVKQYMSAYDSSHDFRHIERVHALALRLARASPVPLNEEIVTLAALLHDVGDAKYTDASSPAQPVSAFLLDAGAEASLANTVQRVVSHVSFSHEQREPAKVAAVLAEQPELGVVQDADRLDAIGAVGIGRCFTYGATRAAKDRADGKGCTTSSSMEDSIAHFGDKLEKLEGMMKTEEGRRLARERTERLVLFKTWWTEETCSSDGTLDLNAPVA